MTMNVKCGPDDVAYLGCTAYSALCCAFLVDTHAPKGLRPERREKEKT